MELEWNVLHLWKWILLRKNLPWIVLIRSKIHWYLAIVVKSLFSIKKQKYLSGFAEFMIISIYISSIPLIKNQIMKQHVIQCTSFSIRPINSFKEKNQESLNNWTLLQMFAEKTFKLVLFFLIFGMLSIFIYFFFFP